MTEEENITDARRIQLEVWKLIGRMKEQEERLGSYVSALWRIAEGDGADCPHCLGGGTILYIPGSELPCPVCKGRGKVGPKVSKDD